MGFIPSVKIPVTFAHFVHQSLICKSSGTRDNIFKGNEMPKDTNQRSNGIFRSTSVSNFWIWVLEYLGEKKKICPELPKNFKYL